MDRFCSHCGAPLRKGAAFCTNCGHKTESDSVAGRVPLADAGQAPLNQQRGNQYHSDPGGSAGRNSGSGIGKYAAAAAAGVVAGAAVHSLLSDDGRTYAPAGGSYAGAGSLDRYAGALALIRTLTQITTMMM